MYKLLIADDEEVIREGLCNIVDWKSLGYEVVQAVEDGQDAVEYLKSMPVDIILADIKMTFVTGLDLAKYVHQNKPSIRVVIISGYKEFEFARQALSYNVKYYLLKPTRLSELKEVFTELKEEMDKEFVEREKLNAQNSFQNFIDKLNYMDNKLIYNFIIDLFSNLKNKLRDRGIDMGSNIFDYEAILKLSDINEIKLWGCTYISNISNHDKRHKDTSERNVIQKARKYIDDNFDKDIGLDEVAEFVFLSPIYLSRLFKQQTGENFVDYLMKIRMRKAMELLKDPKCKVYEVSINVGYKNTKYFYKIFKEYTGTTPSNYRENALNEGLKYEKR